MRTTSCLLLLTLLLCCPGQGGAYLPPPYGKVITAPLPDLPVTLDPAHISRASERQLALLLFDPLYRLAADGRPVPCLVEPEPELGDGERTWRWRLRTGAQLHNGQPLLLSHVAASLTRALRGPHGYLLAVVRTIDVEANQLVMRLNRRAPELPLLLAAPLSAVAVQYRGHWIGTGPYRLKSWTGSGVTLAANPAYLAGRPYLDELRFRRFDRASAEMGSFQVGALQLSFHGTSIFGGQPRYSFATVESPVTTLVYLALGRNRAELKQERVRLALLQGIDRARLGRLAGSGSAEVADSPVCQRTLARRGRAGAFDRGNAQRLLAQLRRERLKLALLVDDTRFDDRIVAGQLVADLDRIGVAMTIDPQPAAEYEKRLATGRFELALGRQVLQVPLASASLAGAWAAAGLQAEGGRCMVAQHCGAAQVRAFMKRLPLVPLVHLSQRVAYDSRLGPPRIDEAGSIDYASLYWTRGTP